MYPDPFATKQCRGPCGQELPLDAFYRRTRSRDGHQDRCRACTRPALDAAAEARRQHQRNARTTAGLSPSPPRLPRVPRSPAPPAAPALPREWLEWTLRRHADRVLDALLAAAETGALLPFDVL